MGASTKEIRNSEVCKLFDYGFANCRLYQDDMVLNPGTQVPVTGGKEEMVSCVPEQDTFTYLLTRDQAPELINKEVNYSELNAPVQQGDIIGEAVYYYDGQRVGAVPLLAGNDVEMMNYGFCFRKMLFRLFCVREADVEGTDEAAVTQEDTGGSQTGTQTGAGEDTGSQTELQTGAGEDTGSQTELQNGTGEDTGSQTELQTGAGNQIEIETGILEDTGDGAEAEGLSETAE